MSEKVVDKVKKRIGDLEQAIQRLDFVKRHLNQNSSEIKTQIHTSISRHLETLRNREVWLLDQVDTVLVGKEEVLQRQQARLNKALGILHSSLAHATDSGDSDEDTAARHLVQALEELNTTELRAEETPYIAFRADHVTLRESILSYGRVDANGMPLLSAFADEDKPSASLPRHVEEYEDTEHHVFYKALQDGKANSSSIRVSMPKLSSRVEDWLQRPMLQLTTSACDVKSPSSETVGTPLSQTTCAIQNWLSEIKHNPDLEDDDDFEIVDHSGSSQRDSPMDEDVKPLISLDEPEVLDMFSHIPWDRRQWLQKEVGARSSPATGEDLHTFFQHIPQDTSIWLATARRQLASLDELKRGGWFRHIPKETASWLRRAHDKRAMSLQAAVPDMFAHISHDKNMWLKKKIPMPVTVDEKRERAEERNSDQVGAESKDSFLSVSSYFSHPAPLPSIPSVVKESVAGTPAAVESWLLHQEAGAASACGGFEDVEAGLSTLTGVQRNLNSSSNIGTWLAGPGAEEADLQPSATISDKFFAHISSNKSDWLLSDQHRSRQSSPSQAIDLQKVSKESVSQWLRSEPSSLLEKSVTVIPSSPLASYRQSVSHLTTFDWLLGHQRQDSDGAESLNSWKVLQESPVDSATFSLSSVTTSGRQIPPLDIASWIYQKNL